jgi:hypothetical protein
MRAGSVPNHQQLAIEMTQEMVEKMNDLGAAERAREQSEVKVPSGHTSHG